MKTTQPFTDQKMEALVLLSTCYSFDSTAIGRRAVVALASGATFAKALPVPATTDAQRTLQGLGDGTRKLSDEGIGEGDLVAELLRRTEANKERNSASVKRSVEANAFTAIDGSVERRIVKGLDGQLLFMNPSQILELKRTRRLACAPSVMEPCRMVEPGYGGARDLDLPEVKQLVCDEKGKNCRFQNQTT